MAEDADVATDASDDDNTGEVEDEAEAAAPDSDAEEQATGSRASGHASGRASGDASSKASKGASRRSTNTSAAQEASRRESASRRDSPQLTPSMLLLKEAQEALAAAREADAAARAKAEAEAAAQALQEQEDEVRPRSVGPLRRAVVRLLRNQTKLLPPQSLRRRKWASAARSPLIWTLTTTTTRRTWSWNVRPPPCRRRDHVFGKRDSPRLAFTSAAALPHADSDDDVADHVPIQMYRAACKEVRIELSVSTGRPGGRTAASVAVAPSSAYRFPTAPSPLAARRFAVQPLFGALRRQRAVAAAHGLYTAWCQGARGRPGGTYARVSRGYSV